MQDPVPSAPPRCPARNSLKSAFALTIPASLGISPRGLVHAAGLDASRAGNKEIDLDWQGALDADQVLARQILKKVLAVPIYVRPTGRRSWTFVGIGRYDAVLVNGIAPGEVVVENHRHRDATEALRTILRALGDDLGGAPAPISGSSDADRWS